MTCRFRFGYVADMETEALHPITKFRSENDLTLEAFGAMIGVQKAAVSKWESGVSPSPASAIEIDRATNGRVSKSDLRPDLWPREGDAA